MKTDATITICSADKSHIPKLIAMWQAIDSFPQTVRPFGGDSSDKVNLTRELIEHTLESKHARILLAIDEQGNTIGTISGHVFEKPAVTLTCVGVIYSLWVEKEFRRQGIGSQLLSTLERCLVEKGAQSFQVGWDFSNTLAASWWQDKGYLPYETIASKIV